MVQAFLRPNPTLNKELKIPLAQYEEQDFTEPAAQKIIDDFRQDLKDIEEEILQQNKCLEPPYLYLCPSRIENSITI
ncbi:hypothetical protein KOW79_006412 [Hemibagrus wyckioides]|uniref:Lipoxygenase domain-containing protein n=1 Tax=Hemibagrus wyckioides TaxID=337641 RepID=A0A9D3NWN6_9TELE|nr:hypothetical protein KOW79_006412 [Hemibagrus wyckioides]